MRNKKLQSIDRYSLNINIMLSKRIQTRIQYSCLENPMDKFFFAFCHEGDVICISEVIDISPCPACASSSPAFLMSAGLKFMSGGQESQITVTLLFIDMAGHIPFHTTCEMTVRK